MTQRYSHVSDVPLALAVFLATDHYDHNPDPLTISATTLLKPLRQIILPARLPADAALSPLADTISNRIGAAIHDAIERSWTGNYRSAMAALGYPQSVIDRIRINPTPPELNDDILPIYLEQRLTRKVGKWTVTGKFDFIGEGRVQDFKSSSVWAYQNQVNTEKYTLQGSIYRWLDPERITQDEMDIHYLYVDWRASGVKSDPTYPPRRHHRQTVPLVSRHDTDVFIKKKLAAIEAYWHAPEEEIPHCTNAELWRSDPVFKYYKNPATTSRSTKNFATHQEAVLRYIEDGSRGVIREVPGQARACHYCAAFPLCRQKDALLAAGDLLP
jgi:hypothetical protein